MKKNKEKKSCDWRVRHLPPTTPSRQVQPELTYLWRLLSSVVCIIAFIYLLPAHDHAPLPVLGCSCVAACDLCVAGVVAFIFAVFMSSLPSGILCARLKVCKRKKYKTFCLGWVCVLAKRGVRLKVGNTYFICQHKVL